MVEEEVLEYYKGKFAPLKFAVLSDLNEQELDHVGVLEEDGEAGGVDFLSEVQHNSQ